MNIGRKTIMKTLGLVMAAVLLTTAATTLASDGARPAQQQAGENEPLQTISVTGAGRVTAVPDTAVLRLGVETEAEMAADALSQNDETAQAILDALSNEGIAAADIRTETISLFPRYEQEPESPGRGELAGYTARHILQVRVEAIDTAGQVLDAAVQAGANIVESIHFEISRPNDLLSDARVAAMEDAQAQAEQLAGLAGASLGPVLTIQTSGGSRPVEVEESLAVGDAGAISPGIEVIEVRVNVTWTLETAP